MGRKTTRRMCRAHCRRLFLQSPCSGRPWHACLQRKKDSWKAKSIRCVGRCFICGIGIGITGEHTFVTAGNATIATLRGGLLLVKCYIMRECLQSTFVIRRGWHQDKYLSWCQPRLITNVNCKLLFARWHFLCGPQRKYLLMCWMALSIHSLLMSVLSVHVVRLLELRPQLISVL
jgi:hypothetical protein